MFLILLFFLWGCNVSSDNIAAILADASVKSDVIAFQGIGKISDDLGDGTHKVSWDPVPNAQGLTYQVYRKYKEQGETDYHFDSPVYSGSGSFYITEDLKEKGITCYVVRFQQTQNASSDENTREVCTKNPSYSFEGLKKLVSMKDGSYTLKWDPPQFEGASFHVFMKMGTFEEWQSSQVEWVKLGQTEGSRYQTEPIPLNLIACFRVRFELDTFAEDTNEKILCTRDETPFHFSGIKSLASPENGKITVSWDGGDENIYGYKVYLGSHFREVASLAKKKDVSVDIPDLLHGVTYQFGVRAFDLYGRQDDNTKTLSFVLANHLPKVRSVGLLPEKFLGEKPEYLQCVVGYEDEDGWQELKPKFTIRNKKKGSHHFLERANFLGSSGVTHLRYQLADDDVGGDELECEVIVNDGFDDSEPVKSSPYIVPDSQVVATGMSLTTRQNTDLDIFIGFAGRGAKDENIAPLGYVDLDNDLATAIEYEASNGVMISSPPFLCIQGICSGRFRPDRDFYTDMSASEPAYAQIRYKVKAGDSWSQEEWIHINVLPSPMALGFEAQAFQDQALNLQLIQEGAFKNPGQIVGYRTVNANDYPSHIFLRSPPSEEDFKGSISLPPDMEETDDSYCHAVAPLGYVNPGFECKIPCKNGVCSFVFHPKPGVITSTHDKGKLEYNVLVGGLMSSPAMAMVEIKSLLSAAMGFQGLTVEGQSYEAVLKEGQGFEGSFQTTPKRISIVQTSASVDPFQFQETPPNSGVFKATITPVEGFKGSTTMKYVVWSQETPQSQEISSEEGTLTLEFYPKPQTLPFHKDLMENQASTFALGWNASYNHPYGLKASKIHIRNLQTQMGYLDGGDFGPTITQGAWICTGYACEITYVPKHDIFDSSSDTYEKFEYQIEALLDESLLPHPSYVKDAYLADPQNLTLTSNFATASLNIIPIPVISSPTSLTMLESTSQAPSSLALSFTHTHPTGLKAEKGTFLNPPSSGSFESLDMNCDGLGICRSLYTPSLGFWGSIEPVPFTLSVRQNNSWIPSLAQNLLIQVKPTLKPTNLSYETLENTDSQPTPPQTFTIAPGSGLGYTHVNNLMASQMNISESLSNGENPGTLSNSSCNQGICTATYTPPLHFSGTKTFSYSLTFSDPDLGEVTSAPGTLSLTVQERPHWITPTPTLTAYEGETTTVLMENNLSYQIHNSEDLSLIIADLDNHITAQTEPCTSSQCPLKISSQGDYQGPSWIDLKILINNKNISSDVQRWNINILPKARASQKLQYILPSQNSTLTISLRNDPTELLLNEEDLPPQNRSGYTHRKAGKASSVKASPPTKGSLSPFQCNPQGTCTALYEAPPYESGDLGFNYTVSVDGKDSTEGHYNLQLLPSPLPTDFFVSTYSGTDPISINFALGTTYQHPQNTPVSRLEILDQNHGTATPINLGSTPEKNCSTLGQCQVQFLPSQDGYTTPPNTNPQDSQAYFTYKLYSWDTTSQTEVPSKIHKVAVNIQGRPQAKNFSMDLSPTHTTMTVSLNENYTSPNNNPATEIHILNLYGASSPNGPSLPCDNQGTCTVTLNPKEGFQGPGFLNYTILAGGQESSTGKVYLNVSSTPGTFKLLWTSLPTLDHTCTLQLPGEIQTLSGSSPCGNSTCEDFSGNSIPTLDDNHYSNSGTSSLVTTNPLPPSPLWASWNVKNATGETQEISQWIQWELQNTNSTTEILNPTPEQPSDSGTQRTDKGCLTNCQGPTGSLAMGQNFACSLTPSPFGHSSAYCWGQTSNGQMGRGSLPTQIQTPKEILSPSFSSPYPGLVSIQAGKDFACAIVNEVSPFSQEPLSQGTVYCWGNNEYGQLGHGMDPLSQNTSPYPVHVMDDLGKKLENIQSLSLGENHACAVNQDGRLHCWGRNHQGQLGLGHLTSTYVAKEVRVVTGKNSYDEITSTEKAFDVGLKFLSVQAGQDHTCAIRSLAEDQGQVFCWGGHTYGQLGDGDLYDENPEAFTKVAQASSATSSRLYPVLARDENLAPLRRAVALGAGEGFTCAVFEDQRVGCWGKNHKGQVKLPTSTTEVFSFMGISDAVDISLGTSHGCVLTKDGKASCWGNHDLGQLGRDTGDGGGSWPPGWVTEENSNDPMGSVVALKAGYDSACLLSRNGKIYCWGDNKNGQIPFSSSLFSGKPMPVLKSLGENYLPVSLKRCSLLQASPFEDF